MGFLRSMHALAAFAAAVLAVGVMAWLVSMDTGATGDAPPQAAAAASVVEREPVPGEPVVVDKDATAMVKGFASEREMRAAWAGVVAGR